MEACSSLGELGEPASVPLLVKRLDDGAPPVRQNAAIALGTIGARRTGSRRSRPRSREGPADLRFQAATSLAEIDPRARVRADCRGARRSRSPGRRRRRARARRDRRSRARSAALAGRLEHADPGARFDVAYALAELEAIRAAATCSRPRSRMPSARGTRSPRSRTSAPPTTRRCSGARSSASTRRPRRACSPPGPCSRSTRTGPTTTPPRRVLIAALGGAQGPRPRARRRAARPGRRRVGEGAAREAARGAARAASWSSRSRPRCARSRARGP